MRTKAKPIFVCRIPYGSEITKETASKIFEELQSKLIDYHLVGLFDSSVKRVEFECFNSEFSQKEFDELKVELEKSMSLVFEEIEKEKRKREETSINRIWKSSDLDAYDAEKLEDGEDL